MAYVLQHLIASDQVQGVFPDLGSKGMDEQFAEHNRKRRLIYPRSEDDVKENLIAVGITFDNHERYSNIWKREVSSRHQSNFL
jgi:hypothetical protein